MYADMHGERGALHTKFTVNFKDYFPILKSSRSILKIFFKYIRGWVPWMCIVNLHSLESDRKRISNMTVNCRRARSQYSSYHTAYVDKDTMNTFREAWKCFHLYKTKHSTFTPAQTVLSP
jgi:hypothetical protein